MLKIEWGQVLTQILAFLLVFAILKKVAWRPILRLLLERREKIDASFQAIEEQKGRLHDQMEFYQKKLQMIDVEAHNRMQEAINEGKKAAVKIQEEAVQNAEKVVEKAHEEIQSEVVRAKEHLKKDVAELSVMIAKKIMQDRWDGEKQDRKIQELIDGADFYVKS